MIARFAGALLGLLAFTITTAAGLLARNPVEVTLSRGIFALVLFCLIGSILGKAAQMVVAEHERDQETKIRNRFRESSVPAKDASSPDAPTEAEGASEGT